MSRYIDADALEYDTEWSEYHDGFTAYSQMAIDTAPSIDICFCRECEHFWKYSNLTTKCVFHLSLVNADDFCSYGVKKGADNEAD